MSAVCAFATASMGPYTPKGPEKLPFWTQVPARGARSIALARFRAEIFVELAFLALVLVGIGGGFALAGDVGPFRRIGRVDPQPFLEAALGVGDDRLGRAFGLADSAVDAFAGVD